MEQISLSVDELRTLIRQVIKQVLAERNGKVVERVSHSGKPLTEKRLLAYSAEKIREVEICDCSVVTPLAKAKARQLGINIVRQESE